MALSTFLLARSYLIQQREDTALRQAFLNARVVSNALQQPGTDVADLLSSLRPDGRTDVAVAVGDRWYSNSVAVTAESIPSSLEGIVADGAGRQRVDIDGTPTLVMGTALPGVDAVYYELFPLTELAETLGTLRIALSVSAGIAAIAGAVVGLFASRRVLRPLREVAGAATDISSGSLDRRLDAGHDPDLAPLTDAFNRMVAALQDRIEREARFSSDVSHEMRTPLAAMSAAMAMADRRRDAMPDDLKALLAVIRDQVESFQTLTVDLLDIARVDAGSASPHLEQVDPVEFAERFSETCDRPLEVVVEGDPGPIVADKRRLRQVLTNLVVNAQRYAGGADQMVVRQEGGVVQFLVHDRGPGVPAAERELIFGRFSRGRAAAAAPEARGSGLGLALAREHVELHQGRIWVEDRPGGGARFVIELPAAARFQHAPEPTSVNGTA